MNAWFPVLFVLAACASNPKGAEPASEAPPAATVELPPEAHQFDFWVGDWECRTPDGTLGGTNRITLECAGRVLQEHWEDTTGGVGTSLNMYDPVTGKWHQTWVDQSGTLLQLDGGLNAAGSMVMEGTRPRRDGNGDVQHRITWTPADGTVHQVWTYSIDAGTTWNTAADLVYSKR